jgi:16S rRNA G1207 methylase RsmC
LSDFLKKTTLPDTEIQIPVEDAYFYKTINYRFGENELVFRVSQNLFSSYQVDIGTQFLLKTIGSDYRAERILDIGCGYGPIGLALKASNPTGIVHMIDRDALAVEYARQNSKLSGFIDLDTYGSLDYDNVNIDNFDLVISNIPGKAGLPVIAHMIKDAPNYLNSDGMVAVVVVSPLELPVKQTLKMMDNAEILKIESHAGHAVFHYRFKKGAKEIPGNQEISAIHDHYFRGSNDFSYRSLHYGLDTAYGLHEFDNLSYQTLLLLDEVTKNRRDNYRHVLILNPGVGHMPVAVWRLFHPEQISMVDRDMLSLRYSKKNLILNECPENNIFTSHQVGIQNKSIRGVDLLLFLLKEEESPGVVLNNVIQSQELISGDGLIMLAGTSTAITRLIARIPKSTRIRVKKRTKARGYSIVLLEKR